MYDPSPFLISTAALTSIFSFFFGGYFSEREKAYQMWIRYTAYQEDIPCKELGRDLCARLESKERVFRQAKGLLKILLLTLVVEFMVFQLYSVKYIFRNSEFYQPDALHTYLWFNTLIGVIVLINCAEMMYIRWAWERMDRFPYFRLRRRVTGQDRLSMLWSKFNCSELKKRRFDSRRIPVKFYRDRENKVRR